MFMVMLTGSYTQSLLTNIEHSKLGFQERYELMIPYLAAFFIFKYFWLEFPALWKRKCRFETSGLFKITIP